jgi:2',3'-cyclic-nucleotide 2'-phosphodiesterase (5'-nucleotidase family)
MIDIEGYKIGIIGISTVETVYTTVTNISELQYEDYVKIINIESEQLRKKGANAVIVIAHVGLYCQNDPDKIRLEYKLRDKNTQQAECSNTEEAAILLEKLKPGTIDLFLAGHKHGIVHNWVNGIPAMSTEKNGRYAQIVYLPFDKKTKKLVNDKIVIEGPLPICEKLFKNEKLCDLSVLDEEHEIKYGNLVDYTFHGIKIEKEESVSEIGKKYQDIFDKYDKDYLTKTYEHFESSKEKENSLGNFYTDFLRHISGADISVVNPGSFRTPFYRGNITNATIHSFDPFGNKIVKFYAFGWEIKKMFKMLQKGKKGFYPFSGLKMTVRALPKRQLLSIKLYNGIKEEEIIDNKLYSIVSTKYCFPLEKDAYGGDNFREVYNWFRPRNGEYIHIKNDDLTRDALINYLRNIDELIGAKYYNQKEQRMRIIE